MRLITLVVLLLASTGVAHENVQDKYVVKRMHAMVAAKESLDVLTQMISGAVRFDARQASAARKQLISFTGDLKRLFRRNRMDPLSNARTSIWDSWDTFKTRSDLARNAANGLNTRNLDRLGNSLPDMIEACLACHRLYRKD
ncbi:MAG: cytochrome c [Sedimentitalea sp.]